jgi:hypothetical protein
LKLFAGMIIAFASVPLMILGLQASRIFERMIS